MSTPFALRVRVTLPRRITAGRTFLLTRRTVRRHHLFRPDKLSNQIYLYCLAVAANKFGVEVHLPSLMSTHEHLGCTDVRGNLSDFLRKLHRSVGNAMKVHRKWEGPIWDDRPTNALELPTPEAVIQEFAYALVNPVSAGLVKHARGGENESARKRVARDGSSESSNGVAVQARSKFS